MHPKISILVPIYKVEKYLHRCIESVISQNFTDWEMILVNDGSPDNSPQICDEYTQRDKRIQTVHKINGGLPSARLAGFQKAHGEFLIFLDADDFLLPNALTTLYNAINKGYDIVRSKVYRIAENGTEWNELYGKEQKEIISHIIYQKALILNITAPYLHSAIYKASLFNEEVFQNLIHNHITVGEDWITNFCISAKVERLLNIDQITYAYALNGESMINSYVKGEEYQKKISQTIRPYLEKMDDSVKEVADRHSIITKINSFFIPELSFSFNNYQDVKNKLPQLSNEIKQMISPKRLLFINILPLYYCYTRLFCLAAFIIKQKCKKRKVLN